MFAASWSQNAESTPVRQAGGDRCCGGNGFHDRVDRLGNLQLCQRHCGRSTIMKGFMGFTIPLWSRRLITMSPAFVLALCRVSLAATGATAVIALLNIVSIKMLLF
jgi:hypothetical protein